MNIYELKDILFMFEHTLTSLLYDVELNVYRNMSKYNLKFLKHVNYFIST